MRVTILGCGASSGTPAVDVGWGSCDPQNPRNRRLRPSILVEAGDTRLLVDTSPDLREQLLAAQVKHLNGVLYTHGHADHLHGIDDLRTLNRVMGKAIEIYADAATIQEVRQRFAYVLEPLSPDSKFFYKPVLVPNIIRTGTSFRIGDVAIDVFGQDHGFGDTLGFRFGPIAYSTDLTELPDSAFEILKGVSTWIIGTLTETPHPTHAHVGKALDWAKRAGAGRVVLTHLGCQLDYENLRAKLPKDAEPAYDGMVIEAA
jgi:phosphoribosyl 1,2-cyclic phosphate phosphodiesterase